MTQIFLVLTLCLGFSMTGLAQNIEQKQTAGKSIQTQQVTKVKMAVDGMSCMTCVAKVKRTIESLDGIKEVKVSLEEKQAIVTYVSGKLPPEKIQEAVNKNGFKAGKPEKQR